MKVGVLGSLSVVGDDGRTRTLGGQKQRAVFAMLALEPNTHISIDRLAEGVWGDLVPERYVQNVQVYVSTLRRILEPDRTSMMPSRIVAHGPSYELVLADDELDLSRFRSRVCDGVVAYEARQPATAAIALRAALAEWRGQPCADLPDLPFQAAAARLLDDEWWVAFERCIDAELDNGRSGELVAELEQALSRSSIRERTWEQLVLALYRAGRQGDALAAYGRARATLVDELGLEPGPRLRALEREVLEQSPALDAPARASVREARLPVPLTSLIGRDRLISDLSARLFDQRLVVLTGPGGVGKTRVALAVAARYQSEGRTTFFTDLTTVRDVALVAPAIARSVGLMESAGASEVAEAAEREGALLVIDNVEQVVDAADFIASVVALAPAARALVTSRVRLGIPGECVIEVEPLASDVDDAPAVELFWERARATDPRLEPSRHPDAARIVCRAVDGMPLAIELAASRVDVFDPSELARRLAAAIDSAVDFGTGGRRHGSMRAAIRWSTDLLDENELTLFGALSVCAAPVDFPTVLAIGAGAGLDARTAERALENLARASLLRTAETPAGRRFGLLTTTKAIARELLSPSNSHLVEAAHADWFAARALEQRGAADDSWLPQAVADLPDSVVAIERLAARGEASGATDLLAGVFTVAMMTADRYRFVRAVATELVERYDLPPELAARARIVAGGMAYITEDDPAAAELLAAVDDLASDDHFFRARGAMWRAALASDSGAHDDADRLAAAARDEAAALGSVRVRGLAWSISGYVALAAGDAALALACAEERLRLEAPDSAGGANATIELAYALLTQGRIEEAAEQARAALGRAQRLGFPQVRGEAYRCMAWAALLLGDHSTAAGCLLEQLATFDGNDAMNDRVMDLPFTTALAVGLAGWLDEARALWAAGAGLIGRGDPPDFPPNLVALAGGLGLEGGEPFAGDLRVVLHQASTLLVQLLPGGWDAGV